MGDPYGPTQPPSGWRELSGYLDELLELEPAAREPWLEALEARAPQTAADLRNALAELARLEEQNFLSGACAPLLPGTLAGTALGAYTLRKPIGYGGAGTVWLADRSDGRFVGQAAVKLLNAAWIGHPAAQRFVREGSVLARLEHPNVARLLDAGIAPSGQPYLILEYVDGERIDQHCDRRGLSIAQRITLFLDVLAAVAHAHQHLIVHRDLKPSNILVTSEGVVKLLDFGVAALISPEAEQGAGELTRVVPPGLTLEYAAPEQLLGDPITTATDVYALGLVLFVLLAGRHPVPPEGKTAAELVRARLEMEPALPSQIAMDIGQRRLLRGDLDSIIEKALRKNPADRYPTVDLLAADLRRYLAHEPVSARRGSLPYRARKFVRRHRGTVASSLAIALALILAIIVTTSQMIEAKRQRETAVLQARRAEATKDFLQRLLSELHTRGEPLTTSSILERSSELLKAQYEDRPAFVAEMLIELAREYHDLLEVNAGLALLNEARDIAVRIDHPLLAATSECSIARAKVTGGKHDEVASHLARAEQALARVRMPPVEARVLCLIPRGALLLDSGQAEGAIPIFEESRTLLEEAGATNDVLYNTTLSGLATALMNAGRPAEALPVYRSSVAAHEQNGRTGTRMHLISQQSVATALYRLGELRESAEIEQRLRQMRERLASFEDMSVASIVNASITANRLARHDPALDRLPQALARAQRTGDMPFLRLASIELARVRMQTGAPREKVEQTLADMEAAHKGRELPVPSRVLVEALRGELDLREGAFVRAEGRARKLLEQIGYPDSKPQEKWPRPTYLALAFAAKAALAGGDFERALEYAQSALPVVEAMARGPDTSADVGEVLLLMGDAMARTGRTRAARAHLERALRCLQHGYGPGHPREREARAILESLPI